MSAANDKWNFLPAETKDPCNKYVQPKPYTDTMGENGYPNGIPNTQTQMTRGGKAQTKGRGHTTKMG